MRLRPIAALSFAALSAVLLAGCSGTGDGGATPDPSGSADATTCIIDASSGSDSEGVSVEGSGTDLSASFGDDLAFSAVERTIVDEGDGAVVGVGSLVSSVYKIYDGSTGDLLLDSTTTSATDDELVPLLIDASQPSMWAAAADCQPLGSTVVLTVPGSAIGAEGSNYVVVAQTIDELTVTATGADEEPSGDLPPVTLAEDGTPTVTIPDGDAPTELQMETLKTGDGPEVESGDNVVVQYLGVRWSNGEEFDSSWSRGAPSEFSTTGVVEGFQKALEGQKVGSQVVVVIPPDLGYGAGEVNEDDLKGETLVFVVDILGTQRGAQS